MRNSDIAQVSITIAMENDFFYDGLNTMEQTIVTEGEFSREQEKTYVHLPFEMPTDATRLDVEYTYSERIGADPLLTGGNTIDLGVFDARGIDFLNAGFRGWSGSERDHIFIAEAEATPGYLAGALLPGTWHVGLGLYKIARAGCRYRVSLTITTEAGHPREQRLPAPITTLPASKINPRGGQWLRGEPHCHTLHSDGDGTPQDVIQLACERGLDFLAITDHNTTSAQHELAALVEPGLILIRGFEVTTFKGHFNVWGVGDWVDFRIQRPEEMEAAIRAARAAAVEGGAVNCCNHPKPFGPPWEFRDVEGYDCIEVWNGPWYIMNQSSLDFWLEHLARGERMVALGGSDYHRRSELEQAPPRAPGTPTVWVYVPDAPNEAGILQAIRAGHVSLSDEPNGPFLDLGSGAAMMGDMLPRPADEYLNVNVRCLRGAGNWLRLYDQERMLVEQLISEEDELVALTTGSRESLFVRAELRSPDDGMRALTNPIYIHFTAK